MEFRIFIVSSPDATDWGRSSILKSGPISASLSHNRVWLAKSATERVTPIDRDPRGLTPDISIPKILMAKFSLPWPIFWEAILVPSAKICPTSCLYAILFNNSLCASAFPQVSSIPFQSSSSPFSKHSIAKEQVTPALIVSIPRSSQITFARAKSLQSEISHPEPRKAAVSYSGPSIS